MPAPMGPRELAALVSLSVLWGGSFTLIKVAVEAIPPATIVAGQLVVASALLWAYLRASADRLPPPGRRWRLYAVLAVTGNVLPFLLISWSETRIDSALAAILVGTVPVITLVLAHFATRDERIYPARAAGVALGFAGVVVVIGPHALAGLGDDVLAELALIGAATCYAVNVLLVRRIGPGVVRASAAVLLVAAVIAVPLSLAIDRPWRLAPTWPALLAVLALGAFSTALATIVFFRLVRAAGATATAMVNYLIPIVGVALAMLFLGERPRPSEFAALALIVAALALVNRRPRAAPPHSSPSTSRMP
jgi:drug/metabolite transporter (DMT)-like permease